MWHYVDGINDVAVSTAIELAVPDLGAHGSTSGYSSKARTR
jgi:hypothetical protein